MICVLSTARRATHCDMRAHCGLRLFAARSAVSRDSGGGKHYLHLQSPLKTYYLYAETEAGLNSWLDALALPWLGTMNTSARPAGAQGGGAVATADSARQGGLEGEPALLTGGNARTSSHTRPGRLDTRVSLSSRNMEL